MGYEMNVTAQRFRIKGENCERGLALVHELMERAGEVGSGRRSTPHGIFGYSERRYFAWIADAAVKAATTLRQALRCWRWVPDVDGAGDIEYLSFSSWDKCGDDEWLFAALAPVVEHGSYIEMLGEDGMRWRWVFVDGVLWRDAPRVFPWASNELLGLTPSHRERSGPIRAECVRYFDEREG